MTDTEIALGDRSLDMTPHTKHGEDLAMYDAKVIEVADEETDRQAHIGVEYQLTPEEAKTERELLRKIDFHIMPLLMITYGLQVLKPQTLLRQTM